MNKQKKLKRLYRKAMDKKPYPFCSQLHNLLMIENQESDHPGAVIVDTNPDVEEESDEAMKSDKEEQCLSEDSEVELEGQGPTDHFVLCSSIHIGTYTVQPSIPCRYVAVNLSMDSLSFQAPLLSDATKKVDITLGREDIQRVYVHFGRCLPIMFIVTTPQFGELVRDALHMIPNETPYFDPTSTDDPTQKLTFMIGKISQDQKQFIRQIFPGDKKVCEIDTKTANEMFMRLSRKAMNKKPNSFLSPLLNLLMNKHQESRHPGLVIIDTNPDVEEESDEVMKNGKEEIEEEQSLPEDTKEKIERLMSTDYPVECRSIRIGSYKVLSSASCPYVPVNLLTGGLSFQAPLLSDATKKVDITLGSEDIQKVYVHFGRCLPTMFIVTTPQFGEVVRDALHMIPNETPYFDPTSTDDTTQKLTFLIAKISEDQKHFIRKILPGDKKVCEIDQKSANEILIRSTPSSSSRIVKW